MNTEAVQLFSAILALATLAGGLVTLVATFVGDKSAWSSNWLGQIRNSGVWLICMVNTGAMVGSLYFSEIANYAPCKLCWYQRIIVFSTAIITFVAALRKDNDIARYTIVLAPIGLLVAVYHNLLEWFPTIESNVCSMDVPCTAVWFRELGFVTLSFMAGCVFIATTAISIALMRTPIESTTSQEN